MRRLFALLLACLLFAGQTSFAKDAPISRRDGFLLIWQSISRASDKTKEKPFTDVKPGDGGYAEITYAKARGLIDDADAEFHPASPLTPSEALLWLFATRSVEPLNDKGEGRILSHLPGPPQVAALAEHYHLSYNAEASSMTREELLSLMRSLDTVLKAEQHEVSLYSEKFHGKGTAFGETFDMSALTAAHRTFPANTLVRVVNIANGKSVVVRINDRGPFVQGRDMDLSLAAFSAIADRSKGKIVARFERLGDSTLVKRCHDERFQQRITRDVRLLPGIPHTLPLGQLLRLTSDTPFVVREVTYPDGQATGTQTWVTDGETYEFSPSIPGTYTFLMGTKTGHGRTMTMEVAECGFGA